MKLKGFGKYLTFGLRKEWLNNFFEDPENWLTSNYLGNKQVDAVISWLKDAEIIENSDKKKSKISLTHLGSELSKVYSSYEKLVWQILWINLSYNSSVVSWYISLPWGRTFSKSELIELILGEDNSLKPRTIESGLNSLLNTFENSPLGSEFKIGIVTKKNNQRYVEKIGTNEVDPKAVLYSLYKYAFQNNKYDLTVSEFYNEKVTNGIYREFGISKNEFLNILRYLQEKYSNLINVDLKANLDNIHLKKEVNLNKLIDIISE